MQYLLLFALFAAVFTGACDDPAPPIKVESARPAATQPPAAGHDEHEDDGAARITLADAKKDFDSGNAVFIDTRPFPTYQQEHVKGAISITADQLDAKASSLPRDKKIIAYCS